MVSFSSVTSVSSVSPSSLYLKESLRKLQERNNRQWKPFRHPYSLILMLSLDNKKKEETIRKLEREIRDAYMDLSRERIEVLPQDLPPEPPQTQSQIPTLTQTKSQEPQKQKKKIDIHGVSGGIGENGDREKDNDRKLERERILKWIKWKSKDSSKVWIWLPSLQHMIKKFDRQLGIYSQGKL